MDREVKHLRQSTVLLNKRESLVDKRRESVACGLNKAKLQLSSTEHALQMKTNELEKTAFDLQLLQVRTITILTKKLCAGGRVLVDSSDPE